MAPSPGTVPIALRRITLAAVIANVAIVMTGGAVRLSGSGLGCPQWPTCNEGSVVPVGSVDIAAWHQAIEFGNRLVSFVVLAVAVAAVVATLRLRPRRPDLVRPAALLPVGVLVQGVVGGMAVLTGLNPLIVAGHFLVSIALIAAAVTLHHRARRPVGSTHPVIRPDLRTAQHVLVVVVACVLTLGTLVTATGPHAGDADTPRLGLDPRVISQIHADGVFLLLGLTIALWFGLRATAAPDRVRRGALLLLGVALGQGTIGYVQYFTGLPEVLVAAHLLGACMVWIATLHLWLTSTERAPSPRTATPPHAPAGHIPDADHAA